MVVIELAYNWHWLADLIMSQIWCSALFEIRDYFWDLHVAIQNAMGWTDSHLHHFAVTDPTTGDKQYMGIPAEDEFDFDVHNTQPDWNFRVRDYLPENGTMIYLYDYGDNWYHLIEFEGSHEKKSNKKYPICIAGERACPPEDVGGIPGYFNFLKIISDKNNDERKSMLYWVGGKYDPEKFNPTKVKFQSPGRRWKQVFEED